MDLESFKKEVSRRFAEAIRERGLSRASAARDLGVSRQMLQRYLAGRSVPNSATLSRACQVWDIVLTHRGIRFGAAAFRGPSNAKASAIESKQLSLFDAISRLGHEDLEIELLRKEPGYLDLRVRLKFSSGPGSNVA